MNKLHNVFFTKRQMEDFYSLKVASNDLDFNSGDFILAKEEHSSSTALGLVLRNQVILCDTYKNKTVASFSPKDLMQSCYFNILENQNFILTVALGAAGTGKTTIAIAKAVDDYLSHQKKIYLCKPTVMVQSHENNVFGPVPGDIKEKYAPYLGSFEIVLNKVLGNSSKHYLDMMFKNKHVEFMPVEFTRGCTFENCTFILDEVQNLTWHELKTVLSRIGQGSQIILCGDPNQIDANFDYKDSGLCKLITSKTFQKSNFTSSVFLQKQYRGKIPDLIYNIDKE